MFTHNFFFLSKWTVCVLWMSVDDAASLLQVRACPATCTLTLYTHTSFIIFDRAQSRRNGSFMHIGLWLFIMVYMVDQVSEDHWRGLPLTRNDVVESWGLAKVYVMYVVKNYIVTIATMHDYSYSQWNFCSPFFFFRFIFLSKNLHECRSERHLNYVTLHNYLFGLSIWGGRQWVMTGFSSVQSNWSVFKLVSLSIYLLTLTEWCFHNANGNIWDWHLCRFWANILHILSIN